MGSGSGGDGYRERHYTTGDGLVLSYRDYGDPNSSLPAVLCLAGLTRNSKDFHEFAQRISAGRRVLCPDYRGRGRSEYDPHWRRYHVRTYLDDIRHLLAAANLHRVVVLGTSLGGIVAAAMAVAMPCALAGAVLNDIGPELDAGGLGRIVAYVGEARPQPDWEAAARYLAETLPNLPAADEAGVMRIARATYREDKDGLLRVDWDPNLAKRLRMDRGQALDLWPLFLAFGPLSVLALRGALSDVLSAATFERMGERMPGLARVTVPGVGHVPSLAEPEAREAIDALLDRVGN